MRKCAICEKKVEKGTGTYYKGRLVHKERCKDVMKIFWRRYVKRSPRREWKW